MVKMVKMVKMFKRTKLISSIFIIIFFLQNLIISVPKITALPPPPIPNEFISEILPNRTFSLNLLSTEVLIEVNSTNYPNLIDINFNANYTFFNPESNFNVSIDLPFSLGIEVIKSNFNVKLNNTQIDFELYNFTLETINDTEIDLNFISWFSLHNPITLIQCNLTNLETETYTIRYKFNGSINNPFKSKSLLYIVYYLNTSNSWIGNTTGRVEFKVYGELPHFSTQYQASDYDPKVHIFNINGGKSAIWEWINLKLTTFIIGFFYDESSYSLFGIWEIIGIIVLNVVGYGIIIIIIITIVRKKFKKRI